MNKSKYKIMLLGDVNAIDFTCVIEANHHKVYSIKLEIKFDDTQENRNNTIEYLSAILFKLFPKEDSLLIKCSPEYTTVKRKEAVSKKYNGFINELYVYYRHAGKTKFSLLAYDVSQIRNQIHLSIPLASIKHIRKKQSIFYSKLLQETGMTKREITVIFDNEHEKEMLFSILNELVKDNRFKVIL